MPELVLRVDVDTLIGLREGVPRLLELFRRYSVTASFFVSLGPDNSGKALRRLWRPAFLLKMLRTNPFRLYGLRTLLSGTLLPPRFIGEGAPGVLQAIPAEGHELGIHGYDHVRWQDHAATMGEAEIEQQLSQATLAYQNLLGKAPLSSAAPGWRCTSRTLKVQEGFGFLYASDVRGTRPFFPLENGRTFALLQVPTTLPTLDELLGRKRRIRDFLVSSFEDGVNVYTAHAEVEGRAHVHLFEMILKEASLSGLRTVRLAEVAERTLRGGVDNVPRAPIVRRRIPGRSGWVACQGPSSGGNGELSPRENRNAS